MVVLLRMTGSLTVATGVGEVSRLTLLEQEHAQSGLETGIAA